MAASTDDAKLQSFLQWLQANGADLRGCTIRACDRKGFGVFSTAAAANSDGVVMVVPLDLAITPMRVLQDPLVGPRCRALFEDGGADDRLLVMLFLLAERLRPGSLWKPYLDMLPSTVGSSLWFTEEELSELRGTTLYRATVMQRKSLQTLFSDKVKDLVEELVRVDESGSIYFSKSIKSLLKSRKSCSNVGPEIPKAAQLKCATRTFFESHGGQENDAGDNHGDSCAAAPQAPSDLSGKGWASNHKETDIAAGNNSGDKSKNMESIWVEGLVPGIDFCNHDLKALATWEVDSIGNTTGIPASMYLMLADNSSLDAEKEIYINYGNKGNEELLYLYGFVVDNNPHDYLMVHYPVEALKQLPLSDSKMKLLEIQKAKLRCLLPRSLLNSGFFSSSAEDKANKKNANNLSSYSWSGQRKVPSYLHKIVFPQEFITALRTIAMQEHELEHIASLLGEVVGSSEDREPSDAEVQSAIWEVCGDYGALGLLVDLLQAKMTELEEGTGTEASDGELLEKFACDDLEGSVSESHDMNKTKSKINFLSCVVYRRGQKQLTRLFLKEAEHLLELSAKEEA